MSPAGMEDGGWGGGMEELGIDRTITWKMLAGIIFFNKRHCFL